jgi:hypothetical protein
MGVASISTSTAASAIIVGGASGGAVVRIQWIIIRDYKRLLLTARAIIRDCERVLLTASAAREWSISAAASCTAVGRAGGGGGLGGSGGSGSYRLSECAGGRGIIVHTRNTIFREPSAGEGSASTGASKLETGSGDISGSGTKEPVQAISRLLVAVDRGSAGNGSKGRAIRVVV